MSIYLLVSCYVSVGRAVIESDDEDYDSEMDDFIDDSEADLGHISAEIGKIFGYDKRRFEDDYESDGECMESSVGQLMREEQRSLRIGVLLMTETKLLVYFFNVVVI